MDVSNSPGTTATSPLSAPLPRRRVPNDRLENTSIVPWWLKIQNREICRQNSPNSPSCEQPRRKRPSRTTTSSSTGAATTATSAQDDSQTTSGTPTSDPGSSMFTLNDGDSRTSTLESATLPPSTSETSIFLPSSSLFSISASQTSTPVGSSTVISSSSCMESSISLSGTESSSFSMAAQTSTFVSQDGATTLESSSGSLDSSTIPPSTGTILSDEPLTTPTPLPVTITTIIHPRISSSAVIPDIPTTPTPQPSETTDTGELPQSTSVPSNTVPPTLTSTPESSSTVLTIVPVTTSQTRLTSSISSPDMTTMTITQVYTTTYNGTLTMTLTSTIETGVLRTEVPTSNTLSHSVGAIIGVTIGSIVALIIGCLCLFLLCRRYRRTRTLNSSNEDILDATWRPPLQDTDERLAGNNNNSNIANDGHQRFYGASIIAAAAAGFGRKFRANSGNDETALSRGPSQESDSTTVSRPLGILNPSSIPRLERNVEEGGPGKRSTSEIVIGHGSPPSYALSSNLLNPDRGTDGVLYSGNGADGSAGATSKGSLVSFDLDPSKSPRPVGSEEAIAGVDKQRSVRSSTRKRHSFSGPRPQPPSGGYGSRRQSSAPPELNREADSTTDDNGVTEFGEGQHRSGETRPGSSGNLRGLWHRLSSGRSRRSFQSGTSTLKAPSSSHVHNPFGSVESLDIVASPPPPPSSIVPPVPVYNAPSSLLNPPPPSMASAPSTPSSSALFNIPILRFPRSVTGNSYSISAAGRGGGAAVGGLSVPTLWPAFNLPPSPVPTIVTLEDDSVSIRAENLLHPRLLGDLLSSQQPSMTSLRDHLDYSRPLGTGLANNHPGFFDRSVSTSTTDSRPVAIGGTAT